MLKAKTAWRYRRLLWKYRRPIWKCRKLWLRSGSSLVLVGLGAVGFGTGMGLAFLRRH